nr:carbamoyltransferase N-terminal domain-containing protein [Paraburkholderia tuberum]
MHFIDHHLSHIGGSYFVSPFDEAALLSIDGWGEWSTTWLGHAKGRMLQAFGESLFPHSLGCFYSAATEFCGFKPNYDEGKTMGLAPCGDPERFYDKAKSLVRISAAGEIELDLSLFDFPQVTGRFCNDAFYQAFGAPRKRGAPFEDHHRDVAAAFQRVIEESILQLCRVLEKKTVTRNLVLAGGVSLNSVANGRVMRETQFKNIYVMPGAGDNGTCIGAAYYLYNGLLKGEKRYHHEHPYIGTEHSNEAIEDVLRQSKVAYRRSADVCAETASILRKGKIVAWFQGDGVRSALARRPQHSRGSNAAGHERQNQRRGQASRVVPAVCAVRRGGRRVEVLRLLGRIAVHADGVRRAARQAGAVASHHARRRHRAPTDSVGDVQPALLRSDQRVREVVRHSGYSQYKLQHHGSAYHRIAAERDSMLLFDRIGRAGNGRLHRRESAHGRWRNTGRAARFAATCARFVRDGLGGESQRRTTRYHFLMRRPAFRPVEKNRGKTWT